MRQGLPVLHIKHRICNARPRTPRPRVEYRIFIVRLIALCALACFIVSPATAQDADIVNISADTTRWYPDDKVVAQGNVQAVYRDYKILADAAEADLQTNTAVFKGKVKLTTRQYNVEGENLTLNLKTKDWSLDNASSRIEASSLQGNVSGATFIRTDSLSGNETDLAVHSGSLTTCDLEHPHYYISAREMEIHPGSKIIARKVSMVGMDRRLVSLNSFVIPLRGFRSNLLPQVGSSAEEGMYLKTAYAYMATKNAQGFLKLDLMSKRGIGTGVEQTYSLAEGSGLVSVYYLADREIGGNNITGRLQHQQRLGDFTLNVTGDYRTNSYLYYPKSTSRNWQVSLTNAKTSSNTALTLRGTTMSGMGDSESFVSTLRHTRRFNDKLSGMLSLDMRNYHGSSFAATDRELDSVFELRQRDDKYDLSLIASRRTDLDGDEYEGDEFHSSLDRLPELTFDTDTYRSGISLFGLPSRFSVSAGRYHEEPAGISKDRLLFQWDMLSQSLDINARTDLNLSAGFRQAFYADNMAQYVLKLGGVLSTAHNDYLKSRITYNYQRPEGYSPFRFDYTGKYNYLRGVVDYQDSQKLRWSLSSGYDFNRGQYPWQDLSLRLTAHPTSSYAFSVSTGYDINRSKWRSLNNRIQVNLPERLLLDIGTRYDIEKGTLDVARGRIDWRVNDKWRIEGITGWSGALRKFDYKSFRLTRDLHCWEVALVYNDESGFRNDRGVRLELKIKAFPGTDRFGIGQYGQSMDTSMGEYYY